MALLVGVALCASAACAARGIAIAKQATRERALPGFLIGFGLSYSAEGAFEEDGLTRTWAQEIIAELLPGAPAPPRIVDIIP